MLKGGTFLQNRYEIISRIGSGGMADVYKAKDHKLNRFVAVKVLKPEFKDDRAFVSKFRVEAQAAAGLAHANIVNVYDVGEENGINFIVMELVEGITLKNYISKKGKLPVREATSIALQVAAGLEAAHNNGIIHRDVKPQNIIISLDGKAKVADFGIARAASSNTINSNVMGSVHYCAPEQTRGGYSDAKSDIYSMGITMYEMLTGRVPFDGDSTVAVALKHLQEDIQSPRRLVPEIPYSTEQIILKCTQKSPDRRYGNMAELIRDLKESLVNPDGTFVTIPRVDQKAQTVLLSKEELNQIKTGSLPRYDETMNTGAADTFSSPGKASGEHRPYPYNGNYYQNSGYQDVKHHQPYQELKHNPSYPGGYQEQMGYGPADGGDMDGDYRDEEYRPGKHYHERRGKGRAREESGGSEQVVTVISIVAAVIVGCIFLVLIASALDILPFGKSGNSQGSSQNTQNGSETSASALSEMVTVPDVRGKSEAEAQKILRDAGLGYKFEGETSSRDYAKGLVVSQTVASDTSVAKNTTIGYMISSGSDEGLVVPGLANVSQEDAEKALTSMGLRVTVDNSRYSDTVQAGYVITTNPGAGSAVQTGDTVTIYVSQGQDASLVKVPQVEGHYVDDASAALTNLGLYVYITEVTDMTVEKGIVISQDVAAGSSVQTGTAVTITVSAGSPDPDIVIDPEGTWMCNARLEAPDGVDSDTEVAVRIVLEQNGTQTTVFEGTATFPYILNVEGEAGVSTGTAYVYTLDPQTWEITSTTRYDGINFSQVD